VSAGVPLHVDGARSPDLLRRALQDAGYSERHLSERLGVPTLDSVEQASFKALDGKLAGAGALDTLARLFLFGLSVSAETLRAALGDETVDAFRSADLLRVWDEPGAIRGEWFSPVRLVPVAAAGLADDLLLVGDRGDHPDGSPFTPFADIVFSGHNPLTRQFLRLLPRRRSGATLDLCAGTGVAALALAPFSSEAVAADIAERSTHFARFNGWLNRAANLEVVCGDLYEPVRGRRFDRIVAHPPYVPALTQELTYRDGGQSGESIIQGVISGLPEHLNVGGTFHLLCLGMDTTEGSFEQRVRGWLGDAQGEFDLIFAVDARSTPEHIATKLIGRPGGSVRDLDRWRALFEQLHVREFVYGALAGRRITSSSRGVEPTTRRVVLTEDTTADAFDWLFRWFGWLRDPDLRERVLSLRPQMHPAVSLEVRHRVVNQAFEPASYALTNGGRPFFSRLETDAWVVGFLNELGGASSVRDAFHSARARGRVPDGFGEDDMVRLICYLLERGILGDGAGAA
jgi:methylase of polypeptide subunit release factors